jgi:hypothetical protein
VIRGRPAPSVRRRRLTGYALALAPGLLVAATDAALRWPLLTAYTSQALAWYLGGAAVAAIGWAALVVAATGARSVPRAMASALLAALALLAVGTQLQAWDRYRTYLNWRTALMGTSIWPCLAQETWSDRSRALALLLAPVVAVLGVAMGVRRLAPPGRLVGLLALPAGIAALALAGGPSSPGAGWDNWSTPDVLWINAAFALARSMRTHDDVMVTLRWLPAARSPPSLPSLVARPARPRSVLLVVDESVRGADFCSVPQGACATTPLTNAALPGRYGFTEMRALDSTTVLSIAAMMSGTPPGARRSELLTAPMLPEFAHAAGLDTAFWTGQNLLFGNYGRYLDGLPFTVFASGTELSPYVTYETGADDGQLVDRALADLPELREPYLAVLQLSNTHFPYVVDGQDHPFSDRDEGAAGVERTAARYRDGIHRQDRILARFLTSLRALPAGARTVVVFLSDHGEQLGEHGRVCHTWSVHDEEIRVPMWIDAPPGTLTEPEAAQLRALAHTPLTMLDVAPTILDLVGLWDEPRIATWRSRMAGVSLLRGGPPSDRAVVMTNCSEIYSCTTRNWGAMRGTRKLVSSEDETAWSCFDLASDPQEQHDLGVAACGDLQQIAEAGRGAPFGAAGL